MVAVLATSLDATVAKPMEKRREIPGQKPHSATRVDHDRVMRRLDNLGLQGEDAIAALEEADAASRATYFRLKKYEVSVPKLRKIEEWLVKEESKRARPFAPTATEQEQLLEQWRELGEQLLLLDPEQYRSTFDGLRKFVESVRLRSASIHEMFRPTPSGER